jgi:hypothetical protein
MWRMSLHAVALILFAGCAQPSRVRPDQPPDETVPIDFACDGSDQVLQEWESPSDSVQVVVRLAANTGTSCAIQLWRRIGQGKKQTIVTAAPGQTRRSRFTIPGAVNTQVGVTCPRGAGRCRGEVSFRNR